MRSFSKYWKLLLAIVILVILIFARQKISSGLSGAKFSLSGLSAVLFSEERVLALEAEIALLRDQIRQMEDASSKSYEEKKPDENFEFKTARVYFAYPFSGKKTIILNYGKRDGASPNMPVLFGEEDYNELALIGKIIKTHNKKYRIIINI
jgi:hypothetical protein